MNRLLRIAPSIWSWAYILTAIFGGIFVWIVGHRGIYLYDQSGVFDGAWRLVQGQVPYLDCFTPYGPVTFWIQSLFFRLAGVDFSSMVLSAAVINSAAILCVIRLVRRLFSESIHQPTAIGAGLLTAVWFQAPFGTLWFEQTSFFFNLIAILLLVETIFCGDRTAVYFRVGAGCSLAVSILSKQSAGVILLPVPLGVAVISCLPLRRKAFGALFQVSAGILLVAAVFIMWLWTFSSPIGFWQSVVVMSRDLAGSRFARVHSVWGLLWLAGTWDFVRAALLAFFIFAISPRAFSTPNSALISWILLSCIFLQNLFAVITFDEFQNSMGYLGLINSLAFGLFCRLFWKKKLADQRTALYWAKTVIPLVGVLFLFYIPGRDGYAYSMHRTVQQFPWNAQFVERLQVPGASRLIWGDPTLGAGPWNITRGNFEDVNSWLAAADANFVVFADSTILYGLHKRVSPQPWLYLTAGHSFLMSDIAKVDRTILESLQKNKIAVIVLEKFSDFAEVYIYQMPNLRTWIHDEFDRTKEFGPYEVWTLHASEGLRNEK